MTPEQKRSFLMQFRGLVKTSKKLRADMENYGQVELTTKFDQVLQFFKELEIHADKTMIAVPLEKQKGTIFELLGDLGDDDAE